MSNPSAGRPAAGVPIAQVEAVTVTRAGRTVLDAVDLQVAAGESVAVVGPSGSGKSTLLAVLGGLQRPDHGRVRHRGEPALGVPRYLGVVLQGYGLLSLLTAAENVEIALQARRHPPEQVRRRAAEGLARVGLADVAGHLVEELSGGQQQRVAIARALVTVPELLLADEVTAELDAGAAELVINLLFEVIGRGGALVVATHDEALAGRCDRAVRVVDGRISPP